jgi:hypothetical protein
MEIQKLIEQRDLVIAKFGRCEQSAVIQSQIDSLVDALPRAPKQDFSDFDRLIASFG